MAAAAFSAVVMAWRLWMTWPPVPFDEGQEGTVKTARFTPSPWPSSNGQGSRRREVHWPANTTMTKPTSLEDLARKAIDGDREALDALVRALQGDVYGLALRMLWNREDAEDATQEILVRIVTHLSQFRFQSRLKTWAYRLAVNYVLDVKKSAIERLHLSFEQFADELEGGLEPASADDAEHSLLISQPRPSSIDFAQRLLNVI